MSRTATRNVIVPKSIVEPASERPKETTRDFVEQIVVAIILAVLIRGYDAEAFVIPTGSMAPTLMGRHKEVTCPQCGLLYAINASDDVEQFIVDKRADASRRLEDAKRAPDRLAAAEVIKERASRAGDKAQIEAAAEAIDKAKRDIENGPRRIEDLTHDVEKLHEVGLCVNCRARTIVDDSPSFKGDRILVMKFPYELPWLPGSAGPKRWDVVVFHFPEKPETNYIKRLVGLPGEELRINHGDIQTRPSGSNGAFKIERKPPIHQRAMQMLVYDDSHRPKALEGKPEWKRWNASGPWKEETAGTFVATPADEFTWSELRYRHLLPDPEQWSAIENKIALPRAPRPTLITDFYSYNTNTNVSSYYESVQKYDGWLQSNWVGDLTLSCRVDLEAAQPGGMIKFELVEGGISNRCEVDLISGVVSIYQGDKKLGESNPTVFRGIGAHDVEFANVDDRLTLSIDGELIFAEGLPYEDSPTTPYAPTAADLDPVGISIRATKASVSDLVLKRDIYYTQDPRDPDYKIPGVTDSYERDGKDESARVVAMFDFLSDPAKFAVLKDLSSHDAYVIRPDHFMMMGDNSPRSSDSRAWTSLDNNWRKDDRSSWEVPRTMLIGKAFFVYWPHGKPFGPDIHLSRDIRIPFRPYFERMKWIR
jgi:signal peptidase I